MEEKNIPVNVPYIAYESAMARMERINKRHWIALILALILLFGSNFAWFIYDKQYADVVTTTTVEADATDGGNAIINRNGEVTINGTSESDNDN